MDLLEQHRRVSVPTRIGTFVFQAPYKKQRLQIEGYARELVRGQVVSPETQAEALALAWCEIMCVEAPTGFNWNTFEDDDMLVELYTKAVEHDRTFREQLRTASPPLGAGGSAEPSV